MKSKGKHKGVRAQEGQKRGRENLREDRRGGWMRDREE